MKFASSANMSSNDALLTMVVLVGEYEATAAPHLVFTIPNIKLKNLVPHNVQLGL